MQISYNHIGMVDIFKPNRGLRQIATAHLENIVLDFSQIGMVLNEEELERIVENDKKPKVWIFQKQPEQIVNVIRTFAEKCKDQGTVISMAIMPTFSVEDQKQDITYLYPLLKECMHACCENGIQKVVVCPLEADWEINRKFFEQVLIWARVYNLHILLKNCCELYRGHYVRGVCSDAVEVHSWIMQLNDMAREERFGFCMDMGVCNVCGQNMYEFAVALGDEIEAVLVKENNGEEMGAMLPFSCIAKHTSRTDWLNLFRGLRKIRFDGMLILDAHDSIRVTPLQLRGGLLQYIKSVGDYLKWQLELEQELARYQNRVLFGAGNMCRNYMKCYGEQYPPLFTCDNNSTIWGTTFEGLEVKNPKELCELSEDCAIFICNIYYEEIKSQLLDMGIRNPICYFNDEFMPSHYMDRFDSEIREVH